MLDSQWGSKQLSLLIDSPAHKTAHWLELAKFVQRERIPGVELRSVPWRQQQDLLRLLYPGRVKPQSAVLAEEAAAKAKAAAKRKKSDRASIRSLLLSKTSAELKRELLSRNMTQSGTKADLVERLTAPFLAESKQQQGYRWWSQLEKDLNDFFQRVDPTKVPQVCYRCAPQLLRCSPSLARLSRLSPLHVLLVLSRPLCGDKCACFTCMLCLVVGSQDGVGPQRRPRRAEQISSNEIRRTQLGLDTQRHRRLSEACSVGHCQKRRGGSWRCEAG